jgi:transcriptional regulator with XRE-family HTH domain
MSMKRPDSTDIAIGERLRSLRMDKGISQSSVALALGLTFQQVQKYEKGVNRIGGGRLVQIAEILGVSASTLLEGAAARVKAKGDGAAPDECHQLSMTRDGVRLARAFNSLVEQRMMRAAIVRMVEQCASLATRK